MAGLTTKSVKDGGGTPFDQQVYDTGTGGPYQPVNQVAKSDGTVIDPATSTKQPALGTAGSPSADVLSVQGRSGMTPLKVEEPDGEAVSGSVSSATILFSVDMLNYQSISVQVIDAGTSCTISYETSDDNTSWFLTSGISSNTLGTLLGQTSSTTSQMLYFPRRGRFFRARVSIYGSGSPTVVGTLSKSNAQSPGVVYGTIVGVGAHGANITGAPVRVAARALNTPYSTLSTGQVADLVATLVGALITKPYSIPENEWNYPAVSGGITNTSAVTLKAAAGAGLRNYLTSLQVKNPSAVASEIIVRSATGAVVLWRGHVSANMVESEQFNFPNPLKSAANDALEVIMVTTATQTYVNAQGYVAP